MKLASADGRRAVFQSEEDLLGERGGFNFYERVGETTARMATFDGTGPRHFSPLYAASADASRIVFRSYGHWTADDTDEQQDVFTARGGVVERVLRLARRLPGGRRLRPGRYRVTLAAGDTARLTLRLSGP